MDFIFDHESIFAEKHTGERTGRECAFPEYVHTIAKRGKPFTILVVLDMSTTVQERMGDER